MRDGIAKYSGILQWVLVVGVLLILFGLTFFLGIFKIDFEYSLLGTPTNSFYGITYQTLFIFGFYLVLFALFLLLPSLDITSRKNLKSYQRLLLSLGILGLGFILYSLLILIDILPTLLPSHEWFDYFLLGLIMAFSNYSILIFSTEKHQDLANYNRIWVILSCIGIAIEIFSLLTYWSLLWIVRMEPNSWGDLYFIGLIFLFIGGFPLLLSYEPSDKRISYGLAATSFLLIITGLLTYIAPTLALNGFLIPLSIFKYNRYFDYLFFGSLLLISGVAIASRNKDLQKYLRRFQTIWISFLALGMIQYLLSILMEITDTYFIDFGLEFLFIQSDRGSQLFGMLWNVFLINGLITTFTVLIILSSLIFQETLGAEMKQDVEKIT